MAAGSGAPSPRRKADAAALRGAGATKAGHAEASGAGGTLADEPGSRPPSPKAWRGRRGDRGQTGHTTDKRLATTLAQEWESQAFVQESPTSVRRGTRTTTNEEEERGGPSDAAAATQEEPSARWQRTRQEETGRPTRRHVGGKTWRSSACTARAPRRCGTPSLRVRRDGERASEGGGGGGRGAAQKAQHGTEHHGTENTSRVYIMGGARPEPPYGSWAAPLLPGRPQHGEEHPIVYDHSGDQRPPCAA